MYYKFYLVGEISSTTLRYDTRIKYMENLYIFYLSTHLRLQKIYYLLVLQSERNNIFNNKEDLSHTSDATLCVWSKQIDGKSNNNKFVFAFKSEPRH